MLDWRLDLPSRARLLRRQHVPGDMRRDERRRLGEWRRRSEHGRRKLDGWRHEWNGRRLGGGWNHERWRRRRLPGEQPLHRQPEPLSLRADALRRRADVVLRRPQRARRHRLRQRENLQPRRLRRLPARLPLQHEPEPMLRGKDDLRRDAGLCRHDDDSAPRHPVRPGQGVLGQSGVLHVQPRGGLYDQPGSTVRLGRRALPGRAANLRRRRGRSDGDELRVEQGLPRRSVRRVYRWAELHDQPRAVQVRRHRVRREPGLQRRRESPGRNELRQQSGLRCQRCVLELRRGRSLQHQP